MLDGAALRRWAFRARAALAAHRPGIDALNVFPVPDGDTGTNMLQTLSGALRGLREHLAANPAGRATPEPATADPAIAEPSAAAEPAASSAVDSRLEALSASTVVAARGNSGAILSELIRGLVQTLVAAHGRVDARGLAQGLRTASERGWAAVGRPVEGTMLSVAHAAAAAADRVATSGGRLAEVTGAAVEAAREALAQTPEQLPTLKRAGVVDAGGAGLVVVLSALHEVVTGARAGELTRKKPPTAPLRAPSDQTSEPAAQASGDGAQGGCDAPALGEQVEVTYVVRGIDAAGRESLSTALSALGDSVVLAGDERALRVHVHVDADRVRSAVDAGGGFAAVDHVRLEGLPAADAHAGLPDAGLVTVLSTGLPPTFAGLAGRHLVAGDDSADPGGLRAALTDAAASPVVVLTDTPAVAEPVVADARADGVEVLLVAVEALPAALAALAVHDPQADPLADAQAMQETAAAMLCACVPDTPAPPGHSGRLDHPGSAGEPGELAERALGVVRDLVRRGGGEAELVTICARPHAVAAAQEVKRRLESGESGSAPLEVEVVPVSEQASHPILVGVE